MSRSYQLGKNSVKELKLTGTSEYHIGYLSKRIKKTKYHLIGIIFNYKATRTYFKCYFYEIYIYLLILFWVKKKVGMVADLPKLHHEVHEGFFSDFACWRVSRKHRIFFDLGVDKFLPRGKLNFEDVLYLVRNLAFNLTKWLLRITS